MGTGAKDRLVIFDCDGVLVDSEPIALSVLSEMLGEAGVQLDDEAIAGRFLGQSLASVATGVQAEFGVTLNDDFYQRMRARLFQRFESGLQPMDGIAAALDALSGAGIAYCVASSSQPDRIRKSLALTGLLDRFSDRIFSAAQVERGKPAPDLFLLAAGQLGYEPGHCLVIEDSSAGIRAAQAAGMPVFAFSGGSHATGTAYRAALSDVSPDVRFDAMRDLLQLVDRLGRSKDSLHG